MPPPNTPQLAPSSAAKGKARAPPSDPPLPSTSEPKSTTRTEMHQEIARRERAAHVLGTWELLAWYSANYGEVGLYKVSRVCLLPQIA